MTTRAHTRWKQAAEAIQNDPPKADAIDLSQPDAEAAKLAEKLQAVHTQVTFVRVIHFLGKWVIRPLFWWPIKYYGKACAWAFMAALRSKPSSNDDYFYRELEDRRFKRDAEIG